MAQMDLNNITGDPFALITISVAIHTFPNFAWWAVAFMFVIIIGVIFVFGSNTAHVYGIAALDDGLTAT
ncbi:Transmembrane osmosensor [Ascosphaera pollenicola]|nr:Transmembrane osmosensor [Ascosphaera pollenicola]